MPNDVTQVTSELRKRLKPRDGVDIFVNVNEEKRDSLYIPDTLLENEGVSWVRTVWCDGCDEGDEVLVRWNRGLVTRGETYAGYRVPPENELLAFTDGDGVFVVKDVFAYRAVRDSIIVKRDAIVQEEGGILLPDSSKYRNGQCEIANIGPSAETEAEVGQRWTYNRKNIVPIDDDYGVIKPEDLYFQLCS
jgi:co-chaperonin GroES (HSP10)